MYLSNLVLILKNWTALWDESTVPTNVKVYLKSFSNWDMRNLTSHENDYFEKLGQTLHFCK